MAWPSVYSSTTLRTIAAASWLEPRERGGGERLLDVAQRVGAEARPLPEGLERPGVRDEGVVRAVGDLAQRLAPVVGQRLGEQYLADDLVEHEVDEVVLAGDVRVDAHRPDPELAGDAADGDRA